MSAIVLSSSGGFSSTSIDGKSLVPAIAVGRYLATKNGLYRHTESLIDFIRDFLNVFHKLAFKEKNWSGWDAYLRGDGVQRLKIAEARLKANHGGAVFFIGANASLLNFVVAGPQSLLLNRSIVLQS
jgi:hypothetical protein